MILQPAVPVSQVDSDLVWFPVRITSVLGGGAYTFQEVWITPTSTIQDKTGGRYNGTLDKAYAIDGSTFAVTAAGSAVQVFARRAMGVGGVGWELKGFGGTTAFEIGSTPLTNLILSPVNTVIEVASIVFPSGGSFFVWGTLAAIASFSTSTVMSTAGIGFWLGSGTGSSDAFSAASLPAQCAGNSAPLNTVAAYTPSVSSMGYAGSVLAGSSLKVLAIRYETGTASWASATLLPGSFGCHLI